MSGAALFCFFVAAVGGGFCGGFLYGYNRGVDETESRWSASLKKAAWIRKYRPDIYVGDD